MDTYIHTASFLISDEPLHAAPKCIFQRLMGINTAVDAALRPSVSLSLDNDPYYRYVHTYDATNLKPIHNCVKN